MNVSTIPAATFAVIGQAIGGSSAAPAPEADPSQRRAEAARVLLGQGDPTGLPEFKRYALSFHIEKETNRIVVHVIDPETKQVLRSVPPEDVLRALQHAAVPPGALVDHQA
jgi:hypothetical protein